MSTITKYNRLYLIVTFIGNQLTSNWENMSTTCIEQNDNV